MTVVISISITWECTICKSGFHLCLHIHFAWSAKHAGRFIERIWEREA